MQISGTTKVLGLIGAPVSHSLSPKMHNTAIRLLNIDYVYLGFHVDRGEAQNALKAMRSLSIKGYNVTMPLKQEVIPHLDVITTKAKLMNTVNTIVNDNGVLTGTNTDGYGMIQSIREQGKIIKDSTMCIFGSGGAATAIGVEAAVSGAKKISFVGRKKNISPEFQKTLYDLRENFSSTTISYGTFENLAYVESSITESSILINGTPLGMAPFENKSPIERKRLITKNHIVADAVYYPLETKLLREAFEQGATIIHGTNMLLWQGAKAFQLFTDEEMPVKEIKKLVFDEE